MTQPNEDAASPTPATPKTTDVDPGGKHPAVAGFTTPTSSNTSVGGEPGTGDGPLPTVVETATPGIARALADVEAERLAPDADEVSRNARERALAGHVAPDTVDLPEARIRVDDNEAARKGTQS